MKKEEQKREKGKKQRKIFRIYKKMNKNKTMQINRKCKQVLKTRK